MARSLSNTAIKKLGERLRKNDPPTEEDRALLQQLVQDYDRPMEIVQATLRKLASFSTLVKAPFDAGKYVRPIATDLSAWQLVQLGWVYKRAGRVLHCRLGGSPSSVGGESVIVPTQENIAVVHMVTGHSAAQPPPPGSGPYGPGCVVGNRSIGR